jgi:hypothetical protein
MFIIHGYEVIDLDLDLLVEIIKVVDRQIAVIEGQISHASDPDSDGHFDRVEAIVGLGFVACQQYINATYPQLGGTDKKKWEVIASAPRHAGGRSFAEIANAAANYWKHHDEWPCPKYLSDEVRTREVIESLTSSTADYVLGNLLTKLVHPEAPRFASIVYQLTLWRDLQIPVTSLRLS